MKTSEHDLAKGIKNEIQYKAYDFYSGKPTKQLFKNSFGECYMTETVPAHTVYPEMGVKVNNSLNRHMLIQPAASYVYKTDVNGNITNVLSAEVTTWSKQCSYRLYTTAVQGNYYTTPVTEDFNTVQSEEVFRPYRSYVYNSPLTNIDGTIQNFVDFNWGNESLNQPQHKFWQKNLETTLYDPFSNLLEAMDVNGNYASMKMGYNGSEVILKSNNARYTEIAYTGAEDGAFPLDGINSYGNYYGGEMMPKMFRSNAYAHTGKYSIAVSGGPKMIYHINKGVSGRNEFSFSKNYHASVWVHKDFITQAKLYYTLSDDANPVILSTSSATGNTSLPKAGDWYLLSLDFSIPPTAVPNVSMKLYLENTGPNTIYFDDVRFHPSQSESMAYQYDPQTKQISHIFNEENFYTRFEYDPYGRLLSTYKETTNGEKKLNDYYYNFARKP
jgi:YD repeat-containing protein